MFWGKPNWFLASVPNQFRAVEPEQRQNAHAGIDQEHLVLKQVSSSSLQVVPCEIVLPTAAGDCAAAILVSSGGDQDTETSRSF